MNEGEETKQRPALSPQEQHTEPLLLREKIPIIIAQQPAPVQIVEQPVFVPVVAESPDVRDPEDVVGKKSSGSKQFGANNSEKNSNNSVCTELFERIGKVGRQRRYEERKNGVNSVRDVVLYRYIRGKQYPALSLDMKRWYEFFYFTVPTKGEKSFHARTTYEQHCEAYERGRAWISQYEAKRSATGSLGN